MQASSKYGAPTALASQRQLPAHERPVRLQHDLIVIRTHDRPADYVIRRGVRTQAKSQHVTVDPQDKASECARFIPQRIAERLFGSAQVAVKDWDFEGVGVISLGLAGLCPPFERRSRNVFEHMAHHDPVCAGSDDR